MAEAMHHSASLQGKESAKNELAQADSDEGYSLEQLQQIAQQIGEENLKQIDQALLPLQRHLITNGHVGVGGLKTGEWQKKLINPSLIEKYKQVKDMPNDLEKYHELEMIASAVHEATEQVRKYLHDLHLNGGKSEVNILQIPGMDEKMYEVLSAIQSQFRHLKPKPKSPDIQK